MLLSGCLLCDDLSVCKETKYHLSLFFLVERFHTINSFWIKFCSLITGTTKCRFSSESKLENEVRESGKSGCILVRILGVYGQVNCLCVL